MNIILLSGGGGKRLWPLSNDIRSKQFIKIFKKEDGEYESMVQRVYRQIKAADPEASVTIATGRTQVPALQNQLGEEIGISVEPCRRDTFPAIALAAAYLHDIKGVDEEEPVAVCPADPYVEDDYFRTVMELCELAGKGTANLMLMGITPTCPSEKYGYIIPTGEERITGVSTFKEKPSAEVAAEYIAQGGLWNSGVFAFKLGYVLGRAHELINFVDYSDLMSQYEKCERISFDYAVVEHEKDIGVLKFTGQWEDLGTWNTLTDAIDEQIFGDVRFSSSCQNVHAFNELGVPLLAMGLKNVIVAASSEGILIADKDESALIKPYVDDLDQRIMYAEKSWGSYRVIDIEEGSMTIKVTLNPGHRMNYHSHDRRDEVWTIISGHGKTLVDGMEQMVKAGDVITMAAGCKHTVISGEEGLQLIEVQLGRDISASDKHKYEI